MVHHTGVLLSDMKEFVCLFYSFNGKTNPHAIILYNSFLSQRKEFVCMKEK